MKCGSPVWGLMSRTQLEALCSLECPLFSHKRSAMLIWVSLGGTAGDGSGGVADHV
jgi:hypothetical protein